MAHYDRETSEAFLPPPRALMQHAPLDSWVAVSADLKRIVATGKDLEAVVAHAAALGEHDVILERTPPLRGDHVFSGDPRTVTSGILQILVAEQVLGG